jgi:hypothetical protein
MIHKLRVPPPNNNLMILALALIYINNKQK